jgi:hypothetical protein
MRRMKITLEPIIVAPEDVTFESLALARWYDSQPAVRRLWGIRHEQRLRVIIALEPTLDNDDVYPAWLVNSEAWAIELRARTGTAVHLELLQEFPWGGIDINSGSVVIADLFWRDATL